MAVELDTDAWAMFSPIEGKRIKRAFSMPDQGGLDALEKALSLRMYAVLNEFKVKRIDEKTLHLRMLTCRVQDARQRKGLDLFKCKPVGQVEFPGFASAIDSRIQTKCLMCPPDEITDGHYCKWEFTLP